MPELQDSKGVLQLKANKEGLFVSSNPAVRREREEVLERGCVPPGFFYG
jgi:hypothetical protein